MNDDTIVYLDNVSKIYRSHGAEVYAVRDVSLEIKPGEFFSLLGSSGSGKTTTLRLIGGFEIPNYGDVFISGENVSNLPPYRRNVHTVFQSYALFPHLTVAQNIAYPLTIARVSASEIAPRVEESLRMFRIEGLGDRRPSQLSGGQQQRVALARALISRPKVLLLDEPLSALDAKVREEVRQELRDLQRQTNLTFIYVTHDQEEALALSDRIAVMHDGQVEQIGRPSEIYDRPSTTFVAQFIGKANFLSGMTVACEPDASVVDINGVQIRAIAPHYHCNAGDAVTLMIRPERIRVGHSNGENHVVGHPLSTTYIGQRIETRFATPVGELLATQLGGVPTPTGEAVPLTWSVEDCVVLPPR